MMRNLFHNGVAVGVAVAVCLVWAGGVWADSDSISTDEMLQMTVSELQGHMLAVSESNERLGRKLKALRQRIEKLREERSRLLARRKELDAYKLEYSTSLQFAAETSDRRQRGLLQVEESRHQLRAEQQQLQRDIDAALDRARELQQEAVALDITPSEALSIPEHTNAPRTSKELARDLRNVQRKNKDMTAAIRRSADQLQRLKREKISLTREDDELARQATALSAQLQHSGLLVDERREAAKQINAIEDPGHQALLGELEELRIHKAVLEKSIPVIRARYEDEIDGVAAARQEEADLEEYLDLLREENTALQKQVEERSY